MRRPYTWAASGTILSLLFPLSNGLFLPPDAIKDSLPLSNYDYIVVGGGPSGLTVATRLSEDANGGSAPFTSFLLLDVRD